MFYGFMVNFVNTRKNFPDAQKLSGRRGFWDLAPPPHRALDTGQFRQKKIVSDLLFWG